MVVQNAVAQSNLLTHRNFIPLSFVTYEQVKLFVALEKGAEKKKIPSIKSRCVHKKIRTTPLGPKDSIALLIQYFTV